MELALAFGTRNRAIVAEALTKHIELAGSYRGRSRGARCRRGADQTHRLRRHPFPARDSRGTRGRSRTQR